MLHQAATEQPNPNPPIQISVQPKTANPPDAKVPDSLALNVEPIKEEFFNLNALNVFENDEILKIAKKFGPSSQQPEDLIKILRQIEKEIAEYKKERRYYKFAYKGGARLNIIYLLFAMDQSNASIKGTAQFIDKDANVPDWAAYAVGGTTSGGSSAYWAVSYPAEKKAILALLNYIHRKPFYERACEAAKTPLASFFYLIDESIMHIMNFTLYATLFIAIPGYATLHWAARLTIFLVTEFFGFYFYDGYSNENYRQNWKYWTDWKSAVPSSIPGELARWNWSIPMRVGIQGLLGAIGVRAFPLTPQVGVTIEQTLGWWIPAAALIPMSILYYARTLYPSTYHRYMDCKIRKRELLLQKMDRMLINDKVEARLQRLQFRDLREERWQEMKKKIEQEEIAKQLKADEDDLDAFIESEQKRGYVFRESPGLIPTFIWGLGAGGACGYLTLYTTVSVLGPVLGAVLIAAMYYQSERNLVRDALGIKYLQNLDNARNQPELKENKEIHSEIKVTQPETCCRPKTNCGADGLTFLMGASTAMVIIGAAQKFLTNSLFVLFPYIAIIAAVFDVKGAGMTTSGNVLGYFSFHRAARFCPMRKRERYTLMTFKVESGLAK